MRNYHYLIKGFGVCVDELNIDPEKRKRLDAFIEIMITGNNPFIDDEFEKSMAMIMVKSCDRFVQVATNINGQTYIYFESMMPWEYPREYWDMDRRKVVEMLYAALKPVLIPEWTLQMFSEDCYYIDDVRE